MKPIGLVFIIINLVLAAAFLGYAAHGLSVAEDKQAEIDALQDQLDTQVAELEGRYSAINTELTETKNNRDLLREDKDRQTGLVADLEAEREELKRKNDDLAAKVGGIESKIADFGESIAQSQARAERAEDARREAEQARDEAVDEAAAATQAQRDAEAALATAEADIEELQIRMTQMQEDLSRAETQLTMAETMGFDVGMTGQELIAGRIMDVNTDFSPGLVALNVGTDDGVRRGMTFEVYNGTEYKGQVRVENALADKCSAVIVLNAGSLMERGDYASTQL